jgi:hypothetical protein
MIDWEKLAVAATGPVISAIAALAVGTWLTGKWTERQKKRELELDMANRFYSSYGAFRAIWREWNYYWEFERDQLATKKAALFARACEAEGALEAVFLKLSSERRLSREDLATLGNLRQAYQVLRERIRDDEFIDYGSTQQSDYLEFKRLATYLGSLIMNASSKETADAGRAFQNFREITSNKYEARWRRAARKRPPTPAGTSGAGDAVGSPGDHL